MLRYYPASIKMVSLLLATLQRYLADILNDSARPGHWELFADGYKEFFTMGLKKQWLL